METVEKLREIIAHTENLVFFGGAGVSTESGIPDFRSVDGLYHQQWDYPPETILSHTFFQRNPEEFYRFYRAKMLCDTAKPNAAHKYLAHLEKEGKLKAVITQNIDNLHQMAGSRKVLELHGSVYRNHCTKCSAFYDFSYVKQSSGMPRCGFIRRGTGPKGAVRSGSCYFRSRCTDYRRHVSVCVSGSFADR